MTDYRFEVYDFAHYPAESHAKLEEMVRAGYRIHTCVPNFAECSVMWERAAAPGSEDDGPAPGVASGSRDAPVEHGVLPGRKAAESRQAEPKPADPALEAPGAEDS